MKMKEEANALRGKLLELQIQIETIKNSVIAEGEIDPSVEFDAFEKKIEEFSDSLYELEKKAKRSIVRRAKGIIQSIGLGLEAGFFQIEGLQYFSNPDDDSIDVIRGVLVAESTQAHLKFKQMQCPRSIFHIAGEECKLCYGQGGVNVVELSGIKLLIVLKE